MRFLTDGTCIYITFTSKILLIPIPEQSLILENGMQKLKTGQMNIIHKQSNLSRG